MSDMSYSDSDGDSSWSAVGLSDPKNGQYRDRRALLDTVNQLHSCGLNKRLDLPQIAVVGSQSVGKSSLIEAMSGITLPRSSGTCTRCPIECRLSKVDTPWKCEVFVRFEDARGEIRFGEPISDHTLVEDRIRRAQIAVLNPSSDPLSFLESTSLENNELSFSDNIVSVRISGAEVDDLSFVDLPGIIAAVRAGGNESDVDQVKNLVRKVIARDSCLILLVVSCDTDLENQGARSLAKQVDPNGRRTIPVLTKPDRIERGTHAGWMKLLENREERFRHPWHCVKQPNQMQLESGISHREARKSENDFFANTEPWSTLDVEIRSRLGTSALTEALGTILFDLICKTLPGIIHEVEKRLRETKDALSKLPQKIEGNPVSIVMQLLEDFKKDVSSLIDGNADAGANGLIQSFRCAKDRFRQEIFDQAPNFKPYGRSKTATRVVHDHVDASIENAEDTEPLEPTRRKDQGRVFYLEDVRKMANEAMTRELPQNFPYAIKIFYIKQSTSEWKTPMENLFKSAETMFEDKVRGLVHHHFSRFSAGSFNTEMMRLVRAHLRACSERTHQRIHEMLKLEQEEPFTVNEHYLSDYKVKYKARYERMCNPEPISSSIPASHPTPPATVVASDWASRSSATSRMHLTQAITSLTAAGLPTLTEDELVKRVRASPVSTPEGLVEIMAEVRAYYQVAFKRFVDYISMIIDYELLKQFSRTLHVAIATGIKIGEDGFKERCISLLVDDPTIVRKRDGLMQDLEVFSTAYINLQSVVTTSTMDYEDEEMD